LSYSVDESKLDVLLCLIWLMAVDGEKHDVFDRNDCIESHNGILTFVDWSLVISNVMSELMTIMARAIDVPKLGCR
jgi:hypothetical protein